MTHIKFLEIGQSKSGLTKIWQVCSIQGNVCLGKIKWFSAWRRYVFHPEDKTLYDAKCLSEIEEFLTSKMLEKTSLR